MLWQMFHSRTVTLVIWLMIYTEFVIWLNATWTEGESSEGGRWKVQALTSRSVFLLSRSSSRLTAGSLLITALIRPVLGIQQTCIRHVHTPALSCCYINTYTLGQSSLHTILLKWTLQPLQSGVNEIKSTRHEQCCSLIMTKSASSNQHLR